MTKVRWGVLSSARIGVEKVIPAMQAGAFSEVVAIASRDIKNAARVSKKLNIPKYYGTYQELLADTDVDAVYIPLPNHLHAPWTIKAIDAGKHVLCEKPLALNTQEAEGLLHSAGKHPELKIMEAFMYRFHPQWVWVREKVLSGGIGDLRTIHSFFSYNNIDPRNIRNIFEAGGGGLMDIGCYCVSLSRVLFGREPVKVLGIVELDTQFQTDRMFSGIMDFGVGTATFTCATQLQPFQRVVILGTQGGIELDIPFNAPPDRECVVHYRQGTDTTNISFSPCDQYTQQGDSISRAILGDTADLPTLADSVANMQCIDLLRKSSEQQVWLSL
jgi:predicted dehydrogenase